MNADAMDEEEITIPIINRERLELYILAMCRKHAMINEMVAGAYSLLYIMLRDGVFDEGAEEAYEHIEESASTPVTGHLPHSKTDSESRLYG